MKHTFMKIMALAAAVCGLASSCVDENEDESAKSLAAEVVVAGENSVTIRVTAENLAKFSIVSVESSAAASVPSAADILAAPDAVSSSILSGSNTARITGLEAEVEYTFYVAAADSEGKPFDQVVTLKATTVLGRHMSAKLVSAGIFSIDMELTSVNLAEYAYMVEYQPLG